MIKLIEVAYYNAYIRCYRDGKIERRKIKSKKYKTYTDEWYEVPQTNFDNCGYLRVCVNGRNEYWHRVIWEAFNGEIPDGLEINHKDEIKTNNSLDNLELITHGDNMRYGTRIERTCKPVIGVNIKTGEKVEFPSTAEAGRNGFSQGNICSCCKGERKSHHGYKWYFKDKISS